MNLQYLIKYKSFNSVSEMDEAVKEHLFENGDKLTGSAKSVLYCLAKHSLTAFGACHLKGETIASEVGVSVQTVYRATKKLVELGIISKHKTTKKTGQGASIYVIAPIINTRNVSHSKSVTCQSLETHVNAVVPTASNEISETVTSFSTSSFNHLNNSVVKNVNPPAPQPNVKDILRDIYQPKTVEDKKKFEELCMIAFGRLKQYTKSHNMPYLQMVEIVTNCMRQLKDKSSVRNEFAMYSAMIKRQVEQLFEEPVRGFTAKSKEIVPEWFKDREEYVMPSTIDGEIDFEAERAKVLAKLKGGA